MSHLSTSSLLSSLKRLNLEFDINKGVRKIDAFTANFKVSYEEWSIKKYDPFFNINNREDLNVAKKLIIMKN